MVKSQIISTFDPKLDTILGGGIPGQSFNILAGEPGAGKSIFAHHLLFHYLLQHENGKVLYLTTLSEPPAKVIRYMRGFDFFEPELFQTRFQLDDIGAVIRNESLEEILDHIATKVQEVKPDILVVDSFKAIRDLAQGIDEFRRFVYQFAVRLFSQQCTTILVGEYAPSQFQEGAEFAVADGIIALETQLQAGEYQRTLQVRKLRGQNPMRHPVPFSISSQGIHIDHITTSAGLVSQAERPDRAPTGVSGLDTILQGGLLPGRAVLLSGVSGTGKTTLALQAAHHAIQSGDMVLYYSFEESVSDLVSTANRFGWEFDAAIENGQLRIQHIPQTEIRVEQDLVQIEHDLQQYQPQWIVLDSFSVFLHRIEEPARYREKMYQMKHLLNTSGAIGLLISDIPAHAPHQLSRMGVEETVADGTIVLSSVLENYDRRRYIEVYKMRQTDHVQGQYRMAIEDTGINVYYSERSKTPEKMHSESLIFSPVQSLIGDSIRYDSSWLIRGEPGLGKSTLAMQFAKEGLANEESVLLITADAPERDAEERLSLMGVDVQAARKSGQLQILDAYNQQDTQTDFRDASMLNYHIQNLTEHMEMPCRVIFDSITPLSAMHTAQEFVGIVQQKNRFLRDPKITLLDTHLYRHTNDQVPLALLNGYDIVLDLYATGEKTGSQSRFMQIAKSRDVKADATPQAYQIDPSQGLVVDAQ